MRKITSPKDAQKKRRRNQIILGVILVAVMLASVLGYGLYGSGTDATQTGTDDSSQNGDNSELIVTHNGLDFVFSNQYGLWLVEKDGNVFGFGNTPKNTGGVEFELDAQIPTINDIQGKPLYISSDLQEATIEITNNLGQFSSRVPQEACLTEIGCPDNFPVKTCEDNFIIIQEDEVSSIKQENNCIFIRGPTNLLTKLTDIFLFKVLGLE